MHFAQNFLPESAAGRTDTQLVGRHTTPTQLRCECIVWPACFFAITVHISPTLAEASTNNGETRTVTKAGYTRLVVQGVKKDHIPFNSALHDLHSGLRRREREEPVTDTVT